MKRPPVAVSLAVCVKGQKIHALFRDLPSKFCLDTMRMHITRNHGK